MDLTDVRARIDAVDAQLLDLFAQRMELAADVAASKVATGKAVFDPAREREKLADVAEHAPRGLQDQAIALFSLLMSMSKSEQLRIINRARPHAASNVLRDALLPADAAFPRSAAVCCQGVEGAYSQIAACRLFEVPRITYAPTFDGVFQAVASGAAEFGVVPIENSTAGSVNAVYDLLGRHSCSIVRTLRLRIAHDLLAPCGVELADIREVVSHEQALSQCAGYLAGLGVRTTACANTAQAAERVATSGRRDLAALASASCAELYGLDTIAHGVQDASANYTRFAVIAREPAIYPGATRTSIQLTLTSEPGALYRVLERIYALDIDLVKLESRPIPDSDFEFTFYLDLAVDATSKALATLLDSLDDVCSSFRYFGSYAEIV